MAFASPVTDRDNGLPGDRLTHPSQRPRSFHRSGVPGQRSLGAEAGSYQTSSAEGGVQLAGTEITGQRK